MDIPVELLFVLFFVLASVLDAVGRGRKKKRRIEEMDQEERAEADRPMASAEGRRAGAAGEAETSSRETADSMIPDQLWEILTGSPAPPSGKTRPTESREEPSFEPDAWEGTAREEEGTEAVPPQRESQVRPVRFGLASPTSSSPTIPASLARGLPVEGGRLISSESTFLPSAVGGHRGPSPYAKLLTTAQRNDLRSAIVLAEILGPPVALRDPSSPTSLLGPSS